jgi:hypothetical protein
MALVALSAAALSFVSLWHLGQLAGYGALAGLFPVVVDLGAAACCAAWLRTESRQASVMTWCLLALSVVLNGTTHWLQSTGQAPGWPLVVGVAAIPPLTLGLVVHLAISMDREPAATHIVSSSAEPVSAPAELASNNINECAGGDDLAEPDPVTELIESGAGRRKIARELAITEHAARQLLAGRNGVTR